MSYEKQTWNKYDELKTEEENIENGAVVTDNRMNHMETGIGDNDANLASHLADKNNPHKVTAAQVGLDKVDNVKQASKVEFDSHTSDISNPHKVTATQVGAYSKDESDQKLATQKQAIDSHINNKANPHAVTASQVGAYSKQEIDTKLSKAVMADDSGKVTVNDLEVSGTIKRINDIEWTSLGNFTSIKREGNTVTVKVMNATRTKAGDITLGTIPTEHRPVDSVMTLVPAWSAGTTNDKHVQLNGSSMAGPGGMTILSAAANTQYTFQFKYEI